MRSHCLSLTLLVSSISTTPANAQYFTTPKGFNLPEGNTEAYTSQTFNGPAGRYQYIDGTQAPTTAKLLKGVEMRRRASEVQGNYPPRRLSLIVLLAHSSFASASTLFAANYKGAPTTVYSGFFDLPDFSNGPLPAPAPWAISIPYSTPFSYNGVDDLMIEFQCSFPTTVAVLYPLDMVNGAFIPGGYGTYHGYEPCHVAGHFNPFWINLHNDPAIVGSTVKYDLFATDGPANQAAVCILGLAESYTTLNGQLCAHLQPRPDVLLGVVTNGAGGIGSAATPVSVSYPFPGYVHQVFAQFAALDPTQSAPIKVALSDDIKYTVGNTGPYSVKRILATGTTTASVGVLASSYVPVMRHSY